MGPGAVVRLASQKEIIIYLRATSNTISRRHLFAHSGSWEPFVQRWILGLRAVSGRGVWVLLAICVRALSCVGV